MDVPCDECARGPKGFAGHGELVVQTIGDGCLSLRCRACGAHWSRRLQREGYFAWAALTARMAASPGIGIPVPPLSHSRAGRGMPWGGAGA